MEPLAADDPRVLGGYRLLGRLGAGGMGRVYLGRSAGGRTVAVKAVHAHFAVDEEFRARFRREIESARRVGGAWTAPVLDADPDAAVPWMATGYVAGPSLAQAVAELGPLAEHSVRALGAGLAEALVAVHALGLVHRDVKPSNVLLTLDGPLLIDFGIARATEGTASLTSTGVSVGSPGYMSPEQIVGKGARAPPTSSRSARCWPSRRPGSVRSRGIPPLRCSTRSCTRSPSGLPARRRSAGAGRPAAWPRTPRTVPPPRRGGPPAAAGSGALRSVRAGWLPGPLVERVSRAAVELLNLDAGRERRRGPGLRPGRAPVRRACRPVGRSGRRISRTGRRAGRWTRRTGRCPGWCRSRARFRPGLPGEAPGAAGVPAPPWPAIRSSIWHSTRLSAAACVLAVAGGVPSSAAAGCSRRGRGRRTATRDGRQRSSRRPTPGTTPLRRTGPRRPAPASPTCPPGRRPPPPRSGGSRCPVRSAARAGRGGSAARWCCGGRCARRRDAAGFFFRLMPGMGGDTDSGPRRAPSPRPTARRRPGHRPGGRRRRPGHGGQALPRHLDGQRHDARTASPTAPSPASSSRAARATTSSAPPTTRCW